MVNYKIEEIHSGEELKGLKRKSAEKIFKTINEQKNRAGRQKRTKEEFVTRYLSEHKKCLLTEEEVIIFDQYPLRKKPERPKRIDIIYTYRRENAWSLGIVEAKVEGGDDLAKTANQLLEYECLLKKFLKKRRESFQYLINLKHNNNFPNINLPNDCQITQLDILAPESWWKKQKRNIKVMEWIREISESNIRFLSIPDNYIPKQWPPKDIPVRIEDI